jgi:D-tyrosyl-tRNA(Tyr) deacylase
MKLVLQRVSGAEVAACGETTGKIGLGFVALLGVSGSDKMETAAKLAEKAAKLRVFADENGKTNLSSADVGAEILVVSQFTLYADCRKGNRPSFTNAGPPDFAKAVYELFVEECGKRFAKAESGVFGAHMAVSLVNDGPFTVTLDSAELGMD